MRILLSNEIYMVSPQQKAIPKGVIRCIFLAPKYYMYILHIHAKCPEGKNINFKRNASMLPTYLCPEGLGQGHKIPGFFF